MEYNREHWKPRIATNPNRFRKLNESNDYVELINEPESITQAGTAFSADRLNNIEAGIGGAVAGVNEIQGVVDFTTQLGAQTSLLENKYVTDVLNVSGDIYACVYNGDVYKQTGGVGSFVALGQTSRRWVKLATNGTDVYAIVIQGSIYRQTAKSGDFVSVYSSSLYWSMIEAHNNDIYASSANGSIYKQTGGSGSFVEVGTYSGNMLSLFSHNGHLYYINDRNQLFKKDSSSDVFSLLRTTDGYAGARSSQAGLFCFYDNYLCLLGNNLILQKYITEKGSFSSFTSIKDKLYISAESSGGGIYTAPFLTGNTYRASSSFTLPAMPDGARKRILNMNATTAITVTAYSGTTIEGRATMTLSAGHEVELELIGTDWRKDTATQALEIKPLGNSITLKATPTSVTKIVNIGTVNWAYTGSISIACDGVNIEDGVKVYINSLPHTASGLKVFYGKNNILYGIKKIIVTYDTPIWNTNRQIYAEIVTVANNISTTTLGVVETNRGAFTPSMTEVSSVKGTVIDSLPLAYLRGDISSYQHVFTKDIIGNLTGNVTGNAATATRTPNDYGSSLPTANASNHGKFFYYTGSAHAGTGLYYCTRTTSSGYNWRRIN